MDTRAYKPVRLHLQGLKEEEALKQIEVNFNLLLESVQGFAPTVGVVSELVGDTLVIPKRDASTKPTQEGEFLYTGESLLIAAKMHGNGALFWHTIVIQFGDKGV